MNEPTPRALERAVEVVHRGRARLVSSVPVREEFGAAAVCDGVVHVFDLEGNPRASRAYGWWSIGPDGDRRFVTAVHMWKVRSPADAVRAATPPERRSG
jgi:hypothetical protein